MNRSEEARASGLEEIQASRPAQAGAPANAEAGRTGVGGAAVIDPEPLLGPSPLKSAPGHVLLFASDRLGSGPEELGRVLLRSFVKTQREIRPLPWRMIFLNSGVALTTEGTPIEADLRAFEAEGVEILSCGTCLDYFHSREKLRAGRVSNMREISETLLRAERVIRP